MATINNNTLHHSMLQNFYSIVYYNQIVDNNNNKSSNTIHNQGIWLLESIIEYWGNNKKGWFSHQRIDTFPISTNTKLTYQPHDININLSLLLHYDQIYRHPCEKISNNTFHKKLAFRFATHIAFHILHANFAAYEKSEPWKKVFVLLAIRHNKNLKLKMFALKKLYQLLEINPTNALYLRFLKATILDINEFKEKNIGYNDLAQPSPFSEEQLMPSSPSATMSNQIAAPAQYPEILEKPKYPVYTVNEKTKYMKILKSEFRKTLNMIKQSTIVNNKIAVSISGGVDSMLASLIINEICKEEDNNYEMIMLHICYNNRSCVQKEVELLKYWANKLNCKLYIRFIDEIKRERSSSFRAVYEDITRRIRFAFYKHFKCPIVLGHNQNDCFENIFSNLSKNIHYDDLIAMNNISIEDENIQLVRPMLEMNKTMIFTHADGFEIPHLVDSTPDWSGRGKMRDILIPQINQFDDKILKGLYSYVQYTKMLSSQWHEFFESWYKNGGCNVTFANNSEEEDEENIEKEIIQLNINKDNFFQSNYNNTEFWIRIWFYTNMKTRPSNKSFKNLILCINNQRYERVSLNKVYDAIHREECIIIIDKNMLLASGSGKNEVEMKKMMKYQKGRPGKSKRRKIE